MLKMLAFVWNAHPLLILTLQRIPLLSLKAKESASTPDVGFFIIIINPDQTRYVKNRYIGENVGLISDIMLYTEESNMSGNALFLDFKKALDIIEWEYINNCLKKLTSDQTFKIGSKLYTITFTAAF